MALATVRGVGCALRRGRASRRGGAPARVAVVRARAAAGGPDPGSAEGKKATLDSLASLLGEDTAAEAAAKAAKEKEAEAAAAARAEARKLEAAEAAKAAEADGAGAGGFFGLGGGGEDKAKAPKPQSAFQSADEEELDIANRSLAAISYLLPVLDGLKYAKYLLMGFPLFGIALVPLLPVIQLWESLGFLQIVFFFGLYLGVVNNRELPTFTRFNAQQAILIDILLIVPDLLLRSFDNPSGGAGLQALVLIDNTVFLYVYLCALAGVGASLAGKYFRLPLVGEAAESQVNR